VWGGAFLPGGRLVTACEDGALRVWEPGPPARLLRTLGPAAGAPAGLLACDVSPEGDEVLTTGSDGVVRLWDPAGRRPPRALAGHLGAVRAGLFTPDGARLLSVGDDATLRVWDRTTGRPLRVLRGHPREVWSLSLDRRGRTLTVSTDGLARLWDLDGPDPAALPGWTAEPVAAARRALRDLRLSGRLGPPPLEELPPLR
jgi:hypothetical protein